MYRFFSFLALISGVFLLFEIDKTNPITISMPFASFSCSLYFFSFKLLNSTSSSLLSVLFRSIVRFLMVSVACFCLLCLAAPFKQDRPLAMQKACFANLRVIDGAISSYNLEVPDELKIKSIGDKDLASSGILVKKGFLKRPIHFPTKKCSYSGANLIGSGSCVCSFHGSVKKPNEISKPYSYYLLFIPRLIGALLFFIGTFYVPLKVLKQVFS